MPLFLNFFYFLTFILYNTITLRSSFTIRQGPSSWRRFIILLYHKVEIYPNDLLAVLKEKIWKDQKTINKKEKTKKGRAYSMQRYLILPHIW
jgi:hypothetical protein